MTDAEIIKVLEICLNKSGGCISAKCPLVNDLHCKELLISRCFEIINRQQSEIEKLKEVKHGHWVKCGYKWQCTHCQSLINIDGTPEENLLNHCPNCGAKMEKFPKGSDTE